MEEVLRKVDSLKAGLTALKPLSSENEKRLDKKFRLEFNYNSNHLEGNTLTYGETELLLIFDNTTGNHNLREYEEMKGHDVAFNLIKSFAKDKERDLLEKDIKDLNQIILVRPFWKDAITESGQATRREIQVGEYKSFPNSVRLPNGEIFEYASPSDTPMLMGDLMQWYRENKNEMHPVILACLFHYKLVRIHPFDDGNGRVSRLLMNYVLLNNDFPPVIIKSKEKATYLNALQIADTGNPNVLIEFIANQVIWSLELSIKAAKGESIEEESDFEKELALIQKRMQNIDKTPSFSEDAVWDVLEFSYFPLVEELTQTFDKAEHLFSSKLYFNWISQNKDTEMALSLNSIQRETKSSQILNYIRNAKSMWFEFKFSKVVYRKKTEWIFNFHILFEEKSFKLVTQEWSKDYAYGKQVSEEDKTLVLNEAKKSLLEYLNNGLSL